MRPGRSTPRGEPQPAGVLGLLPRVGRARRTASPGSSGVAWSEPQPAFHDPVASLVEGDHPVDRGLPPLVLGGWPAGLQVEAGEEVDREAVPTVDGLQVQRAAPVEQDPQPHRLLGDRAGDHAELLLAGHAGAGHADLERLERLPWAPMEADGAIAVSVHEAIGHAQGLPGWGGFGGQQPPPAENPRPGADLGLAGRAPTHLEGLRSPPKAAPAEGPPKDAMCRDLLRLRHG
jgi:hypothetical protein